MPFGLKRYIANNAIIVPYDLFDILADDGDQESIEDWLARQRAKDAWLRDNRHSGHPGVPGWVPQWNNQEGFPVSAAPPFIPPPVTPAPPLTGQSGGLESDPGESMSGVANIDLGDGWFPDLLEGAVEYFAPEWAGGSGGTPASLVLNQVAGGTPNYPVAPTVGASPMPGVPTTYQRPAGIIAQHQANHPGHNQYHYGDCWDPVKQRWIHKRKRRRNRLATKSDLSDLAALKGVLGGGKAFEVWIATHK